MVHGVRLSLLVAGLFPISLWAEEAVLDGKLIAITTGQKSEHVISQVYDRLRDMHQLRPERRSVASMLESKNSTEKGGSRIRWQEDGELTVATWEITQTDNGSVQLDSENAKASAVLAIPQDRTGFSASLEWNEESPLHKNAIEWEWMLEIGGDFFAVPTEGVADHQILPVKSDNGEVILQMKAVPRESDTNMKLAEPWWAVVDRNRAFILACQLQVKSGKFSPPLEIHEHSRIQGSTDSFSQTIIIPVDARPAAKSIRADITLYSGLQALNALGRNTAYQISQKSGHTELYAATSREIPKGEIFLYHNDIVLTKWQVKDWTPTQPLILPVTQGSEFLEHPRNCWLELFVEEEEPERINLYPDKSL